jgi:hypothetical protein
MDAPLDATGDYRRTHSRGRLRQAYSAIWLLPWLVWLLLGSALLGQATGSAISQQTPLPGLPGPEPNAVHRLTNLEDERPHFLP